MKATKFLVLLAGLVGVVAFFLPLLAITGGGHTVTISGLDSVKGISDAALPAEGVAGINAALDEIKLIVLAVFAPALLCTLFGLIGVVKQSFGRGLGIGTLLFGLIGLAIWAILNAAANESATEVGEVKGIGMWLLMVSSAGCTLGGLLALIKPDRGDEAPPTRRYAATIKA